VRFGSVAVKTLEDFTFALRGHRPGDRVTVVIEREGVARTMDAVLEERR
jgi:S1-C subfamily serine protease